VNLNKSYYLNQLLNIIEKAKIIEIGLSMPFQTNNSSYFFLKN